MITAKREPRPVAAPADSCNYQECTRPWTVERTDQRSHIIYRLCDIHDSIIFPGVPPPARHNTRRSMR